ncbi:hypothetical protein LCGC14_1960330 [marine sediment metagenome]|uniref:Portal protein n=1 Tax=marine sediment metagenome TaxID=412755 RepID=A0A0F9FF12_9ZZZZ
MKNILGKNYKIRERKSSKFGTVGTVDRGTELGFSSTIFNRFTGKVTSLGYYNNLKRHEIYRTALDKYVHDELARPIINLISNAIFSGGIDFQGNEEQVVRARKIIKDSMIDWSTWGADLEVHGDIFVRSFFGNNPKIASIPPQTIEIIYDENNIIDIRNYVQNIDDPSVELISPAEMTHGKINNTSNMVFGSSTLRAIFWWLDVLDNLWERNWIRCAQYYGSPIVAVTGIPSEHIDDVRAKLQAEAQRPGRNWIFPEGVEIDTLDFAKGYPIELLVDRVYQYILSACNIPQHLVYESDSSRGVAMFSGDAFEMMINSRRRTWTLIILDAIRRIFVNEGNNPDDFNLTINFPPVFTRDLKNLAKLIADGRNLKIFSLKSARERLGLDHSKEEENIAKEKPEDDPLNPPSNVPDKVEDTTQD